MLQVMVLLMTSTTCYRFGGRIFRQTKGLGIGLRASAALARLVMVTWDKTWGYLQLNMGLVVNIFCRYVDDLRLYIRPIAMGWAWSDNGWIYSQTTDDRSPYQRTMQEVN